MKLTISHITEYRYDEPAQFSLQRLHLTPLTGVGQTVIDWKLSVEGAKPEVEYDDQFGNRATLVSLDGQQDATKIIASGEVDSDITQQNSGLFRPLAVTHNYFPGNREAGLADSFSPLTF